MKPKAAQFNSRELSRLVNLYNESENELVCLDVELKPEFSYLYKTHKDVPLEFLSLSYDGTIIVLIIYNSLSTIRAYIYKKIIENEEIDFHLVKDYTAKLTDSSWKTKNVYFINVE